ncbi:MAG: UDP-N-acetylglucosamine 1-carboxyvinyltransferase [bacterium]
MRIEGGERLKGRILLSGAKNAALPILAASILTEERCVIRRVPEINDVKSMLKVLCHLGAEAEWDNGVAAVKAGHLTAHEVPEYLMREMRASNLVLGALLGREGRAVIAYPGGCAIGSRPMNLHFKGLAAMGVRIEERYGFIYAEAKELHGAEIHLDFPSVGATENIMMAAVLARGQTIISNAAKEPEIVDLQNFLLRLGADISGAGSETIIIRGQKHLTGGEHTIIPDRIEAGTFMIAAALTGGEIELEDIKLEHLDAVRCKLEETGVKFCCQADCLAVKGSGCIKPFDIRTAPYPGFPTDMQPQIMTLMTLAAGTSVLNETVFEGRLKHVDELRRMGADIAVERNIAVVRGVEGLMGANVEASDLRAGVALVLAGLAAKGTTVVHGLQHIARGYENLTQKLLSLGAKIS